MSQQNAPHKRKTAYIHDTLMYIITKYICVWAAKIVYQAVRAVRRTSQSPQANVLTGADQESEELLESIKHERLEVAWRPKPHTLVTLMLIC